MSESPSGLVWSQEMAVGNELIDSQHRMLVLLLRKLELAYQNKLDHKVIVGLCLEIKKFTDFHFLSEENVMREIGYPGLERHAQGHSHLLFEIDVWVKKVNQGTEAPSALLRMVRLWLLGHIEGDDLRIADYIKAAGSRPIAEQEYGLYLR
jgi:hemerythrin-like metal-binding protein